VVGVGSGVVAVDVGVGVGVVAVGVGVGVGVADAEADFECDGDGLAVVAGADGVGAAAGSWLAAVGWLTVGDALAGVPALPMGLAGALLVTGLLEARTASTECGTCEPLSARAVTIPADATAITMPAAAAIRASARARRRGGPIACGNPFGPNGPARRVTPCRYVSAGWLVSEHSPSTSSRNQPGRAASGAMPNSAAFRSVPRLRLPQTSH
jgi:hypothetical protein